MALALLLLLVSTWMAFTVGEVEATEAGVTYEKNIVYVHVPSAICTTVCFLVLLVTSIAYLVKGKQVYDYISAASAEVALVLATVLNLTGSIFSRAFWNIWWTATPRLMSSAMLWFLAVAYIILRASIQNARSRARFCAVFGIIAFLDVPLVFLAARMTDDMHIANVEFETPWQGTAFGLSIFGVLLLSIVLIWLKADILKNRAKLESDMLK
jgi:heme exporter protein C